MWLLVENPLLNATFLSKELKNRSSFVRFMTLLSFRELFDMVLMSLVIGFIFKDIFRQHRGWRTPEEVMKNITPGFKISRISDFWYAVLLVAPSIIFHEFGHKFTAMAFGLNATFHAAYVWLGIGVLLKIVMPGFIFFVPAYVSFPNTVTPLQSALIAFAGPAVNGLFWLIPYIYLKSGARPKKEILRYLIFFKRINGFLFIFNMLPIPLFDGYHVYAGLWHAFL